MTVRVQLLDEPTEAMTLRDLLAGEGYEVETASDGQIGAGPAGAQE